MKSTGRTLLAIDAVVNLILGVGLLLFPAAAVELLGLPATDTTFYATMLGGVILGIGLALCIECWGAPRSLRGLGSAGAIVINLCGAGVLLAWLLLGSLDVPPRGRVLLWVVAVTVLGLGVAEIVTRPGEPDA